MRGCPAAVAAGGDQACAVQQQAGVQVRLGRQAETLARQQVSLMMAGITGASCRCTVRWLTTAGGNYLGGFGQ